MARLLAVLIILAALVGVAGYYLHWFDVQVNEEKIQHDTAVAQEKAREFGSRAGQEARQLGQKANEYWHGDKGKDKGKSVAGAQTARGSIKSLRLDEHQFVLQTDTDKEITFYAEPATEVMRDNQRGEIGQLKVGDHAVVVYQVKNDKKVAESITANK